MIQHKKIYKKTNQIKRKEYQYKLNQYQFLPRLEAVGVATEVEIFCMLHIILFNLSDLLTIGSRSVSWHICCSSMFTPMESHVIMS